MKKAKVILSAVAVFAVIGGALAFKAKRQIEPLYYLTPSGTTSLCVTQSFYNTLGAGNIVAAPKSYYTSRVNSTSCAALTVSAGQPIFYTTVAN